MCSKNRTGGVNKTAIHDSMVSIILASSISIDSQGHYYRSDLILEGTIKKEIKFHG